MKTSKFWWWLYRRFWWLYQRKFCRWSRGGVVCWPGVLVYNGLLWTKRHVLDATLKEDSRGA